MFALTIDLKRDIESNQIIILQMLISNPNCFIPPEELRDRFPFVSEEFDQAIKKLNEDGHVVLKPAQDTPLKMEYYEATTAGFEYYRRFIKKRLGMFFTHLDGSE